MTNEIADLFRQRVRERDLDNFLVEELQAAPHFRTWFVAKLPKTFTPPPSAEIRLEKSPARLQDARQTDVRIGWFDAAGALLACVLIESKVTADFRQGQADAYLDELTACRSELGDDRAAIVLVAPAGKLAALSHAARFCATVSVEQIIEALSNRRSDALLDDELSARLAVRIVLLEAICGKRPSTGWTSVTLIEKRRFVDAYAELAGDVIPNLSVRPSMHGPKALTRFFDGLVINEPFPCRVKLKHEFGGTPAPKYANLQFDGVAPKLEALRKRRDLFADERVECVASGKALFIRMRTPGLIPDIERFDEQRDRVMQGLKAIGVLSKWFQDHQAALKVALSS